MHIHDIRDLEPQSEGFFNRGAESINIMGNMISDIFEGLGNVLSGGVSTIPHGSHLSQTNTRELNVFEEANPPPTLKDQRRIAAVNRTVPRTFDTIDDTQRVQDFIDSRF